MILVIADDLTGAAEMAGIALHYGLTAEIQTRFSDTRADVVVLDTHTRSQTPEMTTSVFGDLVLQLQKIGFDHIFKKTDSVLRGHILLEIDALLTGLSLGRSILVPANPSRQRVIRDGEYLVENRPVHKTGFCHDPEYPLTTSRITEMLVPETSVQFAVLKKMNAAEDARIIIGEAQTTADLMYWSRQLNGETLAAGAAEFFREFLNQLGYHFRLELTPDIMDTGKGRLFVLGSASQESRRFRVQLEEREAQVFSLPCTFAGDEGDIEKCAGQWAELVVRQWDRSKPAWMVIDRILPRDRMTARTLTMLTAIAVEIIMSSEMISELNIEGGATASDIISRLGWTRFEVIREWAPGIVRVKPEEQPQCFTTLKPGSYAWPESLLYNL